MKVIASLLLMLALVSCGEKKSFIGKWRLVEIDYSEHLKSLKGEQKEFFESVIEMQSVMLDQTFYDFKEMDELNVITPKKDGPGQIMQIEKWKTTPKKDSLYFVNEVTEGFKVNWSKEDTLVLTSSMEPKRKLILVKE